MKKQINKSDKGFEPINLTQNEIDVFLYFENSIALSFIPNEDIPQSDKILNRLKEKQLLKKVNNYYLLTPKGMRWIQKFTKKKKNDL